MISPSIATARHRRYAPAPRPPAGPSVWPLLAVAALIAGLVALWYSAAAARHHRRRRRRPARRKRPSISRGGRPNPARRSNLPPLDQTDAIVRTLVARSVGAPRRRRVAHDRWADSQLHRRGDQRRRWRTPAQHLQPLRPKGTFATRQSGGLTWINSASYARYDGAAAAVKGSTHAARHASTPRSDRASITRTVISSAATRTSTARSGARS